MGEIRAFKKRTRWTPEEEAILRAHYPTASHETLRARGGTDEISNLRWVCDAANLAKRDLTDEEFHRLCSDVMRWIGQQIAAAARYNEAAA